MIRFIKALVPLVAFGIIIALATFLLQPRKKVEYVNIYNWYGMLPKKVIEQFEKETNIKVRYDVFDNNEVLEAKLFATNSGYDVVFPSASPYVYNHIQAGVYMPLDKALIPNICQINPFLKEEMEKIDPTLTYSIPYIWGTTGIIYDVDKIKLFIDDEKIFNSLNLLFNEANIKKFARFGVSFLEEGIDVFPMAYRYLNIAGKDSNDLNNAYGHLLKIRPYIKRFSTDRTSNDLLMGEVIIAQFWSGDAYRTILEGKKLGKNLTFIIPKEGASLWIDVMAIPKGAPNSKNAHIFINFCLRPDIAAMISNHTYAVTVVDAAKEFIEKELLSVSFLYPSDDVLKTLSLDIPQKNNHEIEKQRTRLWTKIRRYKKES